MISYLNASFCASTADSKTTYFRGVCRDLCTSCWNSWLSSLLVQRVIIQRILPQLCAEFSNHQMVPFVLPNVLLIAEDCTNQEFAALILPGLRPVFRIQEPVQVSNFLPATFRPLSELNFFSKVSPWQINVLIWRADQMVVKQLNLRGTKSLWRRHF